MTVQSVCFFRTLYNLCFLWAAWLVHIHCLICIYCNALSVLFEKHIIFRSVTMTLSKHLLMAWMFYGCVYLLGCVLALLSTTWCVGTFPVVSLIVGEVVERVANEQGCEDPTRGTTSSSTLFNRTVECTEIGAAAAITLCLLVGIIMVRCSWTHSNSVSVLLSCVHQVVPLCILTWHVLYRI